MQKIIMAKIGKWLAAQQNSFLIDGLSSERQNKVGKYIFEADKQRCILGELLLKYLLLKYYKIIDYQLDYNQYGKPCLREFSNVFFNISHAGQWVVCVLGNQEVGVDIEQVSINMDLQEWDKISKYFMSDKEHYLIRELPVEKRKKASCSYWTQKEAFSKCIGVGNSIYDNFRFTLDDSKILRYDEKNYYFECYDIDNNHEMCVCTEGQSPNNTYLILPAQKLIDYLKKHFYYTHV
jgi:Phosphopantetheinyl transferase